ncbi:Cyclin b3,1, putative isoform 2 [Hibiscus syriacus]|uniref:Cyclin b3,1, putative isoform 2 n=1 Tax=Hibiscus syriacus TaxID=106335 RepID=A0A6A2Z6V4_HIBSY|nr:Cyclin b3,1, putative isoform 2 [Hibiscus syriacus]
MSSHFQGKTGDQHCFSRGFKISPQNEASTMRKSIECNKEAVLTTANDPKGSLKNMAKTKGKRDSSENRIVQRKALSDLSNITSLVSSTKVYYGSKSMKNQRSALMERVSVASAAKTVNVSSGRSFKPIVKTALRSSNAQRASKSKCSSGLGKPVNAAAITSEKDIGCTLLENNVATISSEASQRDHTSNGDSDTSINMPGALAKKKGRRRRSYTSLLMAGSKLLEGNGGVKEEEKLPCIDNDDNPLEVSQYVDEIYQYYWISEAMNPSLENYMSKHTDITPHMRGILINWLIEVHLKFDLMRETLYLMEKLVLKSLKFRLNVPTPYIFMLRFIKAAQSDTKVLFTDLNWIDNVQMFGKHLFLVMDVWFLFEHLAFYLIELCLVEYEAVKFKPSLLCASAIFICNTENGMKALEFWWCSFMHVDCIEL